jgi:hypothetical protein
MDELLNSMDDDINELKTSKNINQKDLEKLMTFQSQIKDELQIIRGRKDLEKFSKKLLDKMNTYNPYILSLYNQSIKNQEEILAYIDNFNNIFIEAGFHKIDLYWLDNDTLGVLKDNFTTTIKQNELKKMALKNGLADVDYKFITISQAPKATVRYSTWVRYNCTKKEEQNWQQLRAKLLADKKNFNIKRKFILRF